MAEFALPKHSKIVKGIDYPLKGKAENTKKGFYGGTDPDPNIEIFQDQKRLISADINGIRIINVYVPNGSSLESDKFEYKINWLNCLASFLDEQEKKGELICLMGDFNMLQPT